MSSPVMAMRYGVGLYAPSAPTEGHSFVLPKRYVGGGRGTIYGHGYTSSALEPYIGTGGDVSNRYAAQVGPLLVTDLGGPSTFCNAASQARATDAYNYFVAQYGVSAKVNLFGGSMGAGNLLLWAANNPSKVNAIGLVIPAVNLSDIHDNNRSSLATVIETAWGGLAAWNAGKATADPALLSVHSWDGIPIKLWSSSNDPICVPSVVSAFAASVGAQQQDIGTGGHNAQPIDMQQVAAFFAAHT